MCAHKAVQDRPPPTPPPPANPLPGLPVMDYLRSTFPELRAPMPSEGVADYVVDVTTQARRAAHATHALHAAMLGTAQQLWVQSSS